MPKTTRIDPRAIACSQCGARAGKDCKGQPHPIRQIEADARMTAGPDEPPKLAPVTIFEKAMEVKRMKRFLDAHPGWVPASLIPHMLGLSRSTTPKAAKDGRIRSVRYVFFGGKDVLFVDPKEVSNEIGNP